VPTEQPPNIVLTGFMGTGKSTVGRRLAERLGWPFVDTDAVIEADHGPIPAIFAEQGEDRFRAIEREVAADLARRRATVVATGGRLLLDPANVETLGRSGVVVCLDASVDALVARLADEAAGRPLLRGADPRARITELLRARRAAYARFPQVATDGRSPDEVADAVLAVAEAELGPLAR
jgi:shikimate kinase